MFDSNQDSVVSTLLLYVTRSIWIGTLITGGFISILWYFQERLLFHPGTPPGYKTPDKNPAGMKHPGEQGMDYEDIAITTDDGIKLHAWLMKQPDGSKNHPTLIFFQGNAGNMGFRIPNFHYLHDLVKVNIFSVAYRGYGWSSGTPSEEGLYKDAEAALFHLYGRADIDHGRIFVFGRSIGGAVAIDLASKRFPMLRGVIVENTFTNLRDMANVLLPVFRPLRPIIRSIQRLSMDNLAKVRTLSMPILFISGLEDTLVPPQQMQELFSACGSKHKTKNDVLHGTHNETWHQAGDSYYRKISEFIKSAEALFLKNDENLPINNDENLSINNDENVSMHDDVKKDENSSLNKNQNQERNTGLKREKIETSKKEENKSTKNYENKSKYQESIPLQNIPTHTDTSNEVLRRRRS